MKAFFFFPFKVDSFSPIVDKQQFFDINVPHSEWQNWKWKMGCLTLTFVGSQPLFHDCTQATLENCLHSQLEIKITVDIFLILPVNVGRRHEYTACRAGKPAQASRVALKPRGGWLLPWPFLWVIRAIAGTFMDLSPGNRCWSSEAEEQWISCCWEGNRQLSFRALGEERWLDPQITGNSRLFTILLSPPSLGGSWGSKKLRELLCLDFHAVYLAVLQIEKHF